MDVEYCNKLVQPDQVCNTLGAKHAFGIGIAWEQASLIIHEHEHLKFYIYDCLYHMCLLLNALGCV